MYIGNDYTKDRNRNSIKTGRDQNKNCEFKNNNGKGTVREHKQHLHVFQLF